uniref:(northern house mosquito) hypothetical protein n=1 Tax=Culex pipiens TaxID=7175 RepID=A0A8D8G925_CULPI
MTALRGCSAQYCSKDTCGVMTGSHAALLSSSLSGSWLSRVFIRDGVRGCTFLHRDYLSRVTRGSKRLLLVRDQGFRFRAVLQRHRFRCLQLLLQRSPKWFSPGSQNPYSAGRR